MVTHRKTSPMKYKAAPSISSLCHIIGWSTLHHHLWLRILRFSKVTMKRKLNLPDFEIYLPTTPLIQFRIRCSSHRYQMHAHALAAAQPPAVRVIKYYRPRRCSQSICIYTCASVCMCHKLSYITISQAIKRETSIPQIYMYLEYYRPIRCMLNTIEL